MTYVEGFLTAVPTANRDAYIAHAKRAAPLFREFGATRLVEGWGLDVPRGKVNDMWGAVAAHEDETVVFSWFEYPDKATRDAAAERIMSDPRVAALAADMPFDGRRMIWGGFDAVGDRGTAAGRIVDGVAMPVRADGRDAYARHAETSAPAFLDSGAVRIVDAVADDVPAGTQTDFHRAVHRRDGETVAFGWVEWPDRDTRDAGWDAVMAHPAMAAAGEPPFDGRRMIFGTFEIVVDA